VDLSIEASELDGARVLRLRGEIDVRTSPLLRQRLSELLAAGRTVVVDLTSVEFLDSSALGTFVEAARGRNGSGGALRLACPPPHVQKVFRITRLAEVIPIYASVAQAVTG
jgi:anti-sigma B factor antagonist